MDKILTNHLNERQQNDNKILDNFSNVFIEYQLMREFLLYRNQNICHVYVVPSDSSPFQWFGVMFVQNGIYRGMVLRFEVAIGSTYPDSQTPKVIFESIPFHPLVDPMSGELNTSVSFNDWNSSVHKIWQIIEYTKRVFHLYHFDDYLKDDSVLSSHGFNTKAIDLYKQDFEAFESIVRESIRESNDKINEYITNDSNGIVFGVYNEDIHHELKKKLLSGINVLEESQLSDPTHPSVTGLSWVGPGVSPWSQNGSNQMLSKFGV